MNKMKIGVRLHDLGDKSLPDRITLAGKLGFTSAHLASKDLYKSFGIDRSGLVQELAEQLRQNFDQAGIEVAVYGCYKNLAQPVGPKLDEVIKGYAASARFAKWLGADCVGTETGRPNPENKITDERMSKAGLKALVDMYCIPAVHIRYAALRFLYVCFGGADKISTSDSKIGVSDVLRRSKEMLH
jgi:sugar phosphate isomerase/epimerase